MTDGFSDRYFPRDGSAGAPSGESAAGESVADVDGTVQETAAEHAALAAGTYSGARGAFSTFYTALGLTGQTEVVAQPDGTVLITPGPHTYTAQAFEEIGPWLWREVGGERLLTMHENDGVVDAIGYDSAFTLLRVEAAGSGAVALPVLVVSAVVLLLGLLAWPVSALIRRRFEASSPVGPRGRVARILTRVGAIAALVALVGWLGVISIISAFQVVPDAPLRVIQAVQVIGLLGTVPAAIGVIDAVRFRHGVPRVIGAVLTLLALVGIAWFALAFRLIAPDVSY